MQVEQNPHRQPLPGIGRNYVNSGSPDAPDDDVNGDDIAEVSLDTELDDAPVSETDDFYKNLADDMSEDELDKLATNLIEKIENDKKTLKKRDETYAAGVRNSGASEDPENKGADFQGSNKVVYPIIEEVNLDFSARAIKSLLPNDGLVKTQIIAPDTQEKMQKASAKRTYMNWQLSHQVIEFRSEMEKTISQAGYGGVQYVKIWYDNNWKRPRVQFVSLDKVYLPEDASNFYISWRKTHHIKMPLSDVQAMMRSGIYRDVPLSAGPRPEMTASERATREISGFGNDNDSDNIDEIRGLYESFVNLSLEDSYADGPECPYLVVIDDQEQKILAIYRNWDKNDKTKKPIDYLFEFPCLPWTGPYPIGFVHIIRDIAKAMTGSLRALLDSAHINNAPALLKLKGAKMSGQNMQVNLAQILEIDAGAVDDIKKLFMPLPFNPPNPVLVELMNFMNSTVRNLIGTVSESIPDVNSDAPVGTTLALIEQGEKVFSSIHSRLHHAMQRVLQAIHRLNGIYLDDDRVEEEIGERIVTRADFSGPCDIIPVSDPNIFSEAQRFAQMQAVNQLMQSAPNLYNGRAVQLRNLQTLRIADPETLLLPSDEPESIDPAQENVMAASKKPPSVFEDQDHLAHIETHWQTYRDPLMSQVLFSDPASRAIMVSHVIEHMRFLYGTAMNRVLSQSAGVDDISQLPQPDDKEVTFQAKQAQAMALVTPSTLAVYQQMVSPFAKDVMMEWQKVQQEQQQMQQQQVQQDPAMIMATAAQSETQRKAAKDQAEIQIKGKELQLNVAKEQHDQDVDKAKLAVESQRVSTEKEKNIVDVAVSKQQTEKDLAINQQDNETAAAIAAARLRQQGTAGHLINGNTLTNPNPKG